MAFLVIAALQLLLLASLSSASHFYGASMTYTAKGRNADGSFKVDIRHRETYHACYPQHLWRCLTGDCGSIIKHQSGSIDTGPNGYYRSDWCETATVIRRHIPSNRAFQLSENSCCWINSTPWTLLSQIDLGIRSDTGEPNRSPSTAILPFIRNPQNCQRTYNLMAFDPDGDRVQCRYGQPRLSECASCNQPSGFTLDQGSCTLRYDYTWSPGLYPFELQVEDFPTRPITLSYSDGFQTSKSPLNTRRRRQSATYGTTVSYPWWWYSTQKPTTTAYPQATSSPTTFNWWWWWQQQQQTTTSSYPQSSSTPNWWWYPTTTPEPTTTSSTPTTTAPTTTFNWWWWWQQQQQQQYTTPSYQQPTPNWWWQQQTTPSWYNPQTTTPYTAPSPWWWNQPALTTTSTTTTAAPVWWQSTTTPPPSNSLSKLPLQFSFLVDPPAPSCTDGDYLPKLLYPTPANGNHLSAEVNKELEIRVKAEAVYSTVSNVIISGPLNITKHTTTKGEFVIRWTPILEDLGDHFPICFIVEATAGSSIYQSEMRCVLVVVGKETVKANVVCDESSIRVEVERSSLKGVSDNHLRLSDPSNTVCSLQRLSNNTHVIAVVPLNGCGTQIEEDDENLIFKNEITCMDNENDIITRKNLVEVQFYCQYPKRGNVTLNFAAHRRNITVLEKGFGSFTYQFEFFQSSFFNRMVDPRSYPIDVEVKEKIYMEIEATSSVNNTELFVESCRATPYDNPNYRPTYPIIENGCIVDPTVEIYSTSHQRQFKFGMEAFKFIGLHDQVFISCSVILCMAGDPNTRCSQGCINSTTSLPDNQSHHHHKRAATIQTAQHYISQGPLRLKKTSSDSYNINMNLVFVVGGLLSAIAMVCSVMIYKSRVSKVEYVYQPLSSLEA